MHLLRWQGDPAACPAARLPGVNGTVVVRSNHVVRLAGSAAETTPLIS